MVAGKTLYNQIANHKSSEIFLMEHKLEETMEEARNPNASIFFGDDQDFFSSSVSPPGHRAAFTLIYVAEEALGTTLVALIVAYERSKADLQQTLLNHIARAFFISQVGKETWRQRFQITMRSLHIHRSC